MWGVDKVVGMEYKHFKSLRLMRSEPGLQKMLGTREKFQQLSGSGKRGRERVGEREWVPWQDVVLATCQRQLQGCSSRNLKTFRQRESETKRGR